MGRVLVSLSMIMIVAIGAMGFPLPVIAQTGYGTVREVLLVSSGNHPDRPVFLDLEGHRLVSNQESGDIGFSDAAQMLEVAGAQGIARATGDFDTLSDPPAGASFVERAAASDRSVFFVRTRSGHLAKVMVVEVLLPDKQALRIRYAVRGDTLAYPGDTGRVKVSWGEEVIIPLAGTTMVDLERGVATGAAAADLVFRDGQLFEAGLGQGLQPVARYEPFSFYQSGFRFQVVARLGLAYIVKTRTGRYASVQMVPGKGANAQSIRIRLQTGEAEPVSAEDEAEGLLQYSVTIPVASDRGLEIATGLIGPLEKADLRGGPNRTLVAQAGAGVQSLGGRSADLIKEVPESNYGGLSATSDRHSYAIRTRSGKYAILTVTGRDPEAIYADVVYQTDGTRAFFNFVITEAGDPAPLTGGSGSSGTPGGSGSGSTPTPTPVQTPPIGPAPPAEAEPALGWTSLKVAPSPSGVTLSWTAPPVEQSVLGYIIWRGTDADQIDFQVNTQPVKDYNYIDRSVQPNQSYFYQIQAFYQGEELGVRSNAASTVPGAMPPSNRQVWLQVGNTTAKANGENRQLDVAPVIIDGSTMVPLRFIGEVLGATIAWSEIERKVSYGLEGRSIDLFIGKQTALVNGSTVITLNASPVIIDGTTLVPVRFVSEQLGAKLTWYAEDLTILIEYPK